MSAPRGVAVAALLAAWVLAPNAATAQQSSATAPADAVEAPASLADLGAQALRVASHLRALEQSLADTAGLAALQTAVETEAQRTAIAWAEIGQRIGEQLRPRALASLASSWHAQRRRLASLGARIGKREVARERDLASLDKLRESSTLALDLARTAEAPSSVLERARATLAAIDSARPALERRHARILALEDAVSRSIEDCDDALARIDTARREALGRLFVEPGPPVWRLSLRRSQLPADGPPPALVVASELDDLRLYAAAYPGNLVATALLGLFLIAWCRRVRAPRPVGPGREGVETSLQTPVAAALLVTLFVTLPLRPDPPASLQTLVLLIAIVATVVVLRRTANARTTTLLYSLVALAVANVIRQPFLESMPEADQVVLILEQGALSALLARAAARLHEATFLAAPATRSIGRAGLLASALVSATSATAAALGYVDLADFLGTGVLYLVLLALALLTLRLVVVDMIDRATSDGVIARLRTAARHKTLIGRRVRAIVGILAVLVWIRSALSYFGLRESSRALVRSALDASLRVGEMELAVGHVLAFPAVLLGAYFATRGIVFVLEEDVLSRMALPRGVPFALSTLTRYGLLVAGFLIALGTLGFDITRIALMMSALGIGLGFGLQNVVSNFVSGLILLFERPIQVGDTVQQGTLLGQVRRIGIRSSTIRTLEGAEVIVPNANLVSQEVVNWTLSDNHRRIDITIGVAYGSDPERILELLCGAVADHPDVLASPPPVAFFNAFGDSALEFELRVWTARPDRWAATRSTIHVALNTALRAADIEIPFPQRDLHLVSVRDEAAARLVRPPPPRGV